MVSPLRSCAVLSAGKRSSAEEVIGALRCNMWPDHSLV
jgi:hypothetical protein